MIRFDCPGCGKRLKVEENAAGKRGRCPDCGTPVAVPNEPPFLAESTAEPVPDEMEPHVVPRAPAPPEPLKLPEPSQRPSVLSIPRVPFSRRRLDPWYYTVLEVCARIVAGFFAIITVIVTIAAFMSDVTLIQKIAMWGGAAIFLLFALFWPALVLLVVDAARNLRLIRFRLEA